MVRVVDLESLAPHHCGFESRYPLVYGMLVVLLRCALVPEIMYGGAPEVFLN